MTGGAAEEHILEAADLKAVADDIGGDLDYRKVDALPCHVEARAVGEYAVRCRSGLSLHQVALCLFHAERKAGQGVGDHVDPQQVNGGEKLKVEYRCDEHDYNFGHVRRKLELKHLADVVVDLSALFNSVDDGSKVVVREHHVGDALGDVRSGDAHADADICGFDGGRIVDAVAGHCGDHAACLPRLDYSCLMLGLDSRIDGVFRNFLD